jgi:multidrug resistance efflux pump
MQLTDRDKQEADKIELRSDELKEILGQVPKWIVRNGTISIFLILILLLAGSGLLRYPDVIHTRILITTDTPPAEVTANVSGKIEEIFMKDKSIVEANEVLAVMESATAFSDVQKIAGELGNGFNIDSLTHIDYYAELKLGSIQESYANLVKKVQDYTGYLKLDYHQRKITSVKSELNKYTLYLERLRDQEKILDEDYHLAEKQYKRDSLLYVDGVLSSVQLEKSETQKLNKLYDLKETQTKLASAHIEMSNLQQEILELELKLEESSRQIIQSVQEAYEKLVGQISLWDKQYVIRSPFKGQVSLTKIWTENQYVEQGAIVLTVLPLNQGRMLGKVELPAAGAGKVKEGHKVIIRFDNYPYLEYGTVSGSVASISLVPNNELYSAEIRIDSSRLITNYNVDLIFQQNMPGNAEIITNSRSLLSRIIDPFRSALSRQQAIKR